MKKLTLRISALFVILSLMLSMMVIHVGAASDKHSYNQGTRHQLCTSLSSDATAYYSANSSGYDSLVTLSQSSLLSTLRTLMTETQDYVTSYDECHDFACYTDCEEGRGNVTLIYTSYKATMSDWVSGNKGWNREHVWPKSLGGFDEDDAPGRDIHHIRPSDSHINSKRNNNEYGEVSGGKSATGSSTVGGMSGGTYGGGYFEPFDNVKGDVARICLYVYVRWGGEYSGCSSITNVFENVDVLLDWCESDPVDTWEMGRNDVAEEIQGNRNVFIDYPELAWKLFGREIPSDMKTPSGEAADAGTGSGDSTGGNTGGNTGDSTGGDVVTPECTHSSTELRGVKSASCSDAGYTGDKYCKDCGKKLMSGTSIPKLSHTASDWIIDKDATATESGSKHKICTVCNETIATEVILPADSVSAFVTAVGLLKSADTMLLKYSRACLALDAYEALDDAEREQVSAQYSELTSLLEEYNSAAENINEEHSSVAATSAFVTVEINTAMIYAILPGKEAMLA